MSKLSEISVRYIKGVGPARAKLFENLGVESVEDLLYLFPRRYEDRREMTPIARVEVGAWQTVSGKILDFDARRSWYTKKHLTEMTIDDGSGRLTCVWFNQPYLAQYLKADNKIVCYGKVDAYKDRLQMISPEYEVLTTEEDEQLSLSRIVPIYPLTRGMTQRYVRKIIYACLSSYKNELTDELKVSLRNKLRLSNIKRSIANIHYPDDFPQQEEALKRISFEEFYFFQISIILRRLSITQKKGWAQAISDEQALQFIHGFEFSLTSAQVKVIREIRQDMKKDAPMLRLLQGDVGSGKTLVALFGCRMAFLVGNQSAIMAPTEILAQQHFDNVQRMTKGGPLEGMKAVFLTSRLKAKEKKKVYQQIKDGEVDCVIGTHALLSEDVVFKDLSFVVIDEQHKFGVRQRSLLARKGKNPDVLIMTATPIPRTLCITLYGDLDISIIDEIPPGRGKVKTSLYKEEQIEKVYEIVRKQLKQGKQAYFIYPIIDESEKLDLKAAGEMFKHFQKEAFKDFRLGLIHGQMKKDESRKIMEQFKRKEINLLVATTILEVGVDVPNANVMVIEHAERFGLSQLHQLRGRIGRGEDNALCLLIGNPSTEESGARLKAVIATTDGFKIAQEDLLIRGPGKFFGRHQHGLNELKVANPATQLDILELARKEAILLTEQDPKLRKKENQYIRRLIKQRYPTYLNMVTAG